MAIKIRSAANADPMVASVSDHTCRRLIITALLCISASASGQDRPEDQEGIVIGTVVVNVAEPPADSAFLRGARKLDKIKWGLTIEKAEGFTFSSRHVDVRSGSQQHFLVKLKAGAYRFDQLVAQGFANFYFPVQARFDVAPQATTYIGRLEITLPYRMYEGPAVYRVVDSQDETVAGLENDNAALAKEIGKRLMTIAP